MTAKIWILCLLILSVFAFECTMPVEIPVASPKTETKPELTPEAAASGGSSVWQFNFQSVAAKGGWFVTPLTMIGWIVATLKSRRREQAADELIRSIEAVGDAAKLVKAHVCRKGDPWINQRVKKITRAAQ